MNYISITPDQRQTMLEAIGVDHVDALFDAIPASSRFDGRLDLPDAASELQLQRELDVLAGANNPAGGGACFMGAGVYDHFIPTFIDQLIVRGEFLTAYTPYQAEASQGSLQAFFEFQSQIARLAGLDIANASLYEGASAASEAVNLAINSSGKRRVLVASTVHPDTLKTIRTHVADLPVELVVVPAGENGRVPVAAIHEHADSDTACLLLQSPNVFGLIENSTECFDALIASSEMGNAPLRIAIFNPIACALLKSPGAHGADLAVGEGQPLGVPMQYGGPYLGLFAARKEFIRKMPGRLVGQAFDEDGRRGFALVLQTREQHIRGARATSNVCTNQGLLALRATMYMSAMGPNGIRSVAEQCWHKAHALAKRIGEIDGYSLPYDGEFFHEFVVRCPRPVAEIVEAGRSRGVWPGVTLSTERMGNVGGSHDLLVAVTEKRTASDMDALVELLKDSAG